MEPSSIHDTLDQFAKAGIETEALAAELLKDGAASFVKSWPDLMAWIASKSSILKAA